jgi:hypothetical protein
MSIKNKYDTWTLRRPCDEFGEKTNSHAAIVSGYFLMELVDVLFEDMDKERAAKHYMIPVWNDFIKVSNQEEGVNPYSAGYKMTPSMIVLAQKDLEMKIEKGQDDFSFQELRSLREMHHTLQEARTYVGPVYERNDELHADAFLESPKLTYLVEGIRADESVHMAAALENRRLEI